MVAGAGFNGERRRLFIEKCEKEGLIDKAFDLIRDALNSQLISPRYAQDNAKWLIEHYIGKPPQNLEHTGDGGGSININLIAPQKGILADLPTNATHT